MSTIARALPEPVRDALRELRKTVNRQLPPRRVAKLGARLVPVRSDLFARGTPVDRYYIDNFFRRWNDPPSASEIHGRVLEFYNAQYASAFGGWGGQGSSVSEVEVLDIVENPRATIRGDITDAPQLADGSFDVVICTQVLQLVFHLPRAISTMARILRPGGVLYITVPGVSPGVTPQTEGGGVDHWRFTTASIRQLLMAEFPPEDVIVEGFGNVLAAVASLHGLAAEEFAPAELDHCDPAFETLVAARAIRRS